MAAKKNAKPKITDAGSDTAAVEEFLRQSDHPLKAVLVGMRKIILGVEAAITEGIKWNAPSFFYHDYFATTGLRSKDFVQVVFHTGAKIKASATQGIKIADPTKMLEWHAKDRASTKFTSLQDLQARKAALQAIVRQWIQQM